MKKTVILLLSFVMIAQISFGQFANTPPTGNSSNLCPGVTHRYTSPVNPDGGRCDAIGGWDVTNGKIVANGLNANGSVWAEVKWDNKPTGLIGNMCGVLSVTINSIAQPEIPGNGTILLCGTSSLTISANVSSTANITGYVWDIKGTGVTPTGIVNTTAPQITINYSNWVAGSTQSASVAVGSRNSCGFSTATSPLKDIELLPGVIEKAIPRKAWVQLSPGNINDLLAPLSFSPSLICTSGTMAVSNKPAGASLTWSSNNTAALTVNPTTGQATRLNGFNGGVIVTATLSNACGSATQNTTVWLGTPTFIGTGRFSGNNSTLNSINYYSGSGTQFVLLDTPPSNFAAYSSVVWTKGPGGTVQSWSQFPNGGRLDFNIGANQPAGKQVSFRTTSSNLCGSRVENFSFYYQGGGSAMLSVSAFPNPSSSTLNVQVVDSLVLDENESNLDQPIQLHLVDRFSNKILSAKSFEKITQLSTEGLPPGVYYLNVIYKDAVLRKQIVIKR